MLKNENRLKLLFNSAIKSIKQKIYAIFIINNKNQILMDYWNETINKTDKNFIQTHFDTKELFEFRKSADNEIGSYTFLLESFRFLSTEITEQNILYIVSEAKENINILFSYTFLLAEKIYRIMQNQFISLVIPNLENLPETANIPSEYGKLSFEPGDLTMKVILAGNSAVGKTTLVERFVTEKMNYDYKSTIGLNIMLKEQTYAHWGIIVKFSIYDLGGQEQFKNVREVYYNGAKAGFLVFDVTREDSFHNIPKWYAEVKKIEPDIMLILIGNKVDLVNQRKISKKQGKELAQTLGIRYIETTALNKDFVDEAFKTMGFFFILNNRVLNWKKDENMG